MIKLLDNVCREIARTGCKKIILLNAHGGNLGLVALYTIAAAVHAEGLRRLHRQSLRRDRRAAAALAARGRRARRAG
jgi:creatinine amidohydrolase/Fe(II)-dependent formamide hydrolase-like protein